MNTAGQVLSWTLYDTDHAAFYVLLPNTIKSVIVFETRGGGSMAKDLVAVDKRALTTAQYGDLADVLPELEWLANITNP